MHTVEPLACQRHLFELPDDVSYLDAAAWSPLPRPVRAAGEAGILAKSRPWTYGRDADAAWAERARAAAARLIGAGTGDIAIVGSVSHAVATAARNLSPAPGGRILRVADEFPSQCLAWDRLAVERGLPLHWSVGSVIDLDRLAPAVRAAGAALVVDATQAVGAVPLDVSRLRPDFLAFPTYKWTLGPYSVAFLYAAPHRQGGWPLEENAGNQPPAAGARRYDKGESRDGVALPMAATGMELVAGWGVAAVAARLRALTDQLAEGAASMGLPVAPRALRSPHILGLRVPGGLPEGLIGRLRGDKLFVSDRLGGLRLSPHVWANEADVARCLSALRAALC